MHFKTYVAPVKPAERNRGVLTVSTGPDVGRVVSLPPGGDAVTLGRADECTAAFNDGGLSRAHARIVWIAGTYMVEDLGSTNGTFVNDTRVEAPTPLRDGDRVQLGNALVTRFSLVSKEEEQSLRRAYDASTLDGLTGVCTRKHLDERIDAEIAYAHRHGVPLSVVMLDVDHFKKVNDTYGHPGGDAVLRHVGGLLLKTMRTEDIVGRYGGEEFLIVLRGIDLQPGIAAAERLRRVIESSVVVFESHEIRHTSSFGVAALSCVAPVGDRDAIVKRADARLYLAKQAGRNRVVGSGANS